MTQKRRRSGAPELGQDAFLDIVANLVGILIILVVILGSRSQEVAEAIRQQAETEAPAALQPPPIADEMHAKLMEMERETGRAAAALAESQRLEAAIRQSDMQLALVSRQRGELLDLLAAAQQAWEEKQQELDSEAVERGKLETQIIAARTQLEQLQRLRGQAETADRPVVAVAHLPTPMAKTVFGEELHFRLKGGRLAVVPIERLVEEIQRDFQRSVSSSREGRMDAAVGPIQGFVARYEMDKSQETITQGGRIGTATRIQLVGLTVEPLSEPHGEKLETVLASEGNTLDIELAGRSPEKTTVTVWVYPDSFAEFRKLKEHLYARGYATAARPLPMDRPISGGPQGSKSNAQ